MSTTAAPPSGTPAPQIGAGTTTQPPVDQTQTPPSSSVSSTGGVSGKIAGRYETPEKFEEGYKQLYKEVTGLDWKGSVFGKDTPNSDLPSAENSYKQLRRGISARSADDKPKGDTAPAQPTGTIQIAKTTDPDLDADYDPYKIVESANLKIEDLAKQWQDKGDLTDEQYAALRGARKNLGKSDIKAIAKGMIAEHQARSIAYQMAVGKAVERAGGQESLSTLIKWAESGLTPRQQQAVNAQLADPELVADAIDFIKFKHAEANGSKSDAARGGSASSINTSGFTTLADFKAASDRIRVGQPNPGDMDRLKNTDIAMLGRM